MKSSKRSCHFFLVSALLMVSMLCHGGEGKLIATSGLTQVEGSGGGGIVPWATLSGYDSRDQWSVTAFSSQVDVDDFRLQVWGAGVSLYDRVEISVARQTFDLTTFGGEIKQNVVGLKARLYGDAVYSSWPQVSVGMQYKSLLDKDIAEALGAEESAQDTDFYLAFTKVHLGLACGYNLVWNLNFRHTRANQLGLLGWGGNKNDDRELMIEGSLGVLLNRHVAVGMEYRQKPDNLNAALEEDWRDYFISYIPNKDVNVTLAWAELGNITEGIAGTGDQSGLYLSLTGYLW